MKIVILAPFGTSSEESGVIYLLGRYLASLSNENQSSSQSELLQLRCNGVFSLCDRDADANWTRSPTHCLQCSKDSSALSNWSVIESAPLSSFLSPDVVWQTRCWLAAVSSADLLKARCGDFVAYDRCAASFKKRFGTELPDINNKTQEQILRRLLLSVARSSYAAREFLKQTGPDVALVAGGADFISRSFLEEAKKTKCTSAVFRWDLASRSVLVAHPGSENAFASDLLLEGVANMRSEVKTWPSEILKSVHALTEYLGLFSSSLQEVNSNR